jgi:hypothetical protein
MESIDDVIANMNRVLMETDRHLSEFISSEPDPEEAAKVLVEVHAIKSAISDMYSIFSTDVIGVLQRAQVDELQVKGAQVEIRSGADRKQWEHDKLIGEVARRLIQSSVDMDTGEVVMTTEEVVSRVLDFVQPSYWRVKELAKLGISADQFCEVGESKTNIIVRKAK